MLSLNRFLFLEGFERLDLRKRIRFEKLNYSFVNEALISCGAEENDIDTQMKIVKYWECKGSDARLRNKSGNIRFRDCSMTWQER